MSDEPYRLDHRVKPLEDAQQACASRLDDHEQCLLALERGRRSSYTRALRKGQRGINRRLRGN